MNKPKIRRTRTRGVFVLIRRPDGSILTCLRKDGQRDIPGGGVKTDIRETREAAAAREVWDEIGLRIKTDAEHLFCGGAFQQRVPKRYHGGALVLNRHKKPILLPGWVFLYIYTDANSVSNMRPQDFACCPHEVESVEWMTIHEMLPRQAEFKRGAIRMILRYLRHEFIVKKGQVVSTGPLKDRVEFPYNGYTIIV